MQITLGELLANIGKARQRMSLRNPHRWLFGQCEEVILQLVERVHAQAALIPPSAGEPSPETPDGERHS